MPDGTAHATQTALAAAAATKTQSGALRLQAEDKETKLVDPYNYVGEVLGEVDPTYPYADFLPHNPKRTAAGPALAPFPVTDRAHYADPDYARLRAFVARSGGRIRDIGIAMGSVIEGDAKMEDLGERELDDLALLVARRGVVFFRKQHTLTIEKQREIGAHFGPLHVHPTYAVPRRGDLDDVVVVYTDKNSRPDPYSFSRAELFHSDVTYEVQPPGTTILRLLVTPEVGNDTLWSSGTALYSSLSRPYQQYLESLTALHSGHNQAASRTGAAPIPRREPIETLHPVVRVHPVTGHKAVFVNPGFVTRIVGVPKAESDHTLSFLKDGFAQQSDAMVRWRWEAGDVALWENRTTVHSATMDAWPTTRHGLRVTPQAERPESVAEYEARSGRKAVDAGQERYARLGIDGPRRDDGKGLSGGFRD